MKNPADPNPTNDLPSFFDADEGGETTFEAGTATASTFDEVEPELGDEAGDGEFAEQDLEPQHVRAPAQTAAPAGEMPRPAGGGAVPMVVGALATATAIAMATALDGSNAAIALTRFGLTPATLLVLGGVAFGVAAVRRQLGAMQARLAVRSGDDPAAHAAHAMQESLEFLVAAQHASNERPPAAGEELQHVLMAMQRQDEKINNLTKAIKMYGKPLMEISGQSTELAGAITQMKAAVETAADATQQGFERIETQLDDGRSGKQLAELLDAVHVIAADVDKLCKSSGNQSLEPLQQKVARIEVAVAAVAQRLDNSDVQKSLLRLEDATQKTRDEVHQLRGDGLGKATTQLQDRLEKATKGLADGLQQMRDGNLGGLESGVRDIQRELSGVATAVAQIQAVVRSGKGATAAPAPMASAPAPAPAAAAPAPSPSSTTPAPAATSGDGGNTGYSTGARSTSGKNVLGAIAKLKQMKN